MSSSQALDWRKLFDSPSDQSLVFFPPEVHGGSITVKPPAEVFDEGIRRWHHLLVAQFLGRPLNFRSLQKLVDMLWSFGSLPLAHPEQADGAEEPGA
ncbi:hypothetical protein Gotri_012781 [Gossypium trilobum]|uniref:Uncharacterized protein n=1 Tax=Gossypium trilobum TaxID=34281 RepID=A0A7J9DRD7_9ROSI|nr:hypothetical protein [Gossypium trilobum]